jgi:phage terminase large subunit-like protein
VPYDLWTRQGFIEATEGNVVDYGAIEQRILADAALFQVKEIAYDPWNATHIALRLQDEGATVVEFRQGLRSMAAPTRELEKLIVSRKLVHGANPVTRWMAAKVAVAQDSAGNLKPAKDKSTERIDGIVATIMAIGRAMVAEAEAQPAYSMFFVRLKRRSAPRRVVKDGAKGYPRSWRLAAPRRGCPFLGLEDDLS